MRTTIERWEAGDITAYEALDELTAALTSLEDRLEPLEETKKTMRDHISQLVDYVGGSVKMNGYEMIITQASVTRSYDSRKLDALVARLTTEGQGDIARLIADCGKDSPRMGSLRITKAKDEK